MEHEGEGELRHLGRPRQVGRMDRERMERGRNGSQFFSKHAHAPTFVGDLRPVPGMTWPFPILDAVLERGDTLLALCPPVVRYEYWALWVSPTYPRRDKVTPDRRLP